jgi:hypothetical protein
MWILLTCYSIHFNFKNYLIFNCIDLKETLYALNLSLLTFLCIISCMKMVSPELNLHTRSESGTEVGPAAGG